MDQVLVDALSGVAVPAGVFIVGLIVSLVNRFTKDRIVSNIKVSAEALAALPPNGHLAAREALTRAIEVSASQLALRNRPGHVRWILFISASVLALGAVIIVSLPIVTSGSAATVASYVGGIVAAVTALATSYSGFRWGRREAQKVQTDVTRLREQLGDLDTDYTEIFRDARDSTP